MGLQRVQHDLATEHPHACRWYHCSELPVPNGDDWWWLTMVPIGWVAFLPNDWAGSHDFLWPTKVIFYNGLVTVTVCLEREKFQATQSGQSTQPRPWTCESGPPWPADFMLQTANVSINPINTTRKQAIPAELYSYHQPGESWADKWCCFKPLKFPWGGEGGWFPASTAN